MEEKINKNTYSVYMHRNKINGKVYIGITGRNPELRWKNGNGYYRNKHFYASIKKYGWDDGFEHIIITTNLSKIDAEKMEIQLISYYNSSNPKFGYNINLGGNCTGTMSDETKEKIRQKHLGMKYSEETKKKVSESKKGTKNPNYGKKQKQHVIDAMLKANKGRQKTDYELNMITEKRGFVVFQYGRDGRFINTYRSTGEAARVCCISSQGIKACCEGRNNTNHNCYWRYEKDGYILGEPLPKEELEKLLPKKTIAQYDKDDNLVNEFYSLAEAEKETKINHHGISYCCKGIRKTSGGFKWKYIA